MDHSEMQKAIEEARAAHLEKISAYREWYQSNSALSEDGFEILEKLPDDVHWEVEDNVVKMKGHVKGLQEMTFIMQAFSHDYDVVGLFHENILLLKSDEPATFEGLVVVAMPDRAWQIWGGKMGDIAWGYDGFDELQFNQLGFYEERFPVDIGICVTGGKELWDKEDEG